MCTNSELECAMCFLNSCILFQGSRSNRKDRDNWNGHQAHQPSSAESRYSREKSVNFLIWLNFIIRNKLKGVGKHYESDFDSCFINLSKIFRQELMFCLYVLYILALYVIIWTFFFLNFAKLLLPLLWEWKCIIWLFSHFSFRWLEAKEDPPPQPQPPADNQCCSSKFYLGFKEAQV